MQGFCDGLRGNALPIKRVAMLWRPLAVCGPGRGARPRKPGPLSGLRGRELVERSAEGGLAVAERFDDVRIELAPGEPRDLVDRFLPGPPGAIRPVTRHRVERVRDGEDARAERNCVAFELVGIAAAVPALVVRAHGAQ